MWHTIGITRAKIIELIYEIMEQVLSFIFLCLTGVVCYWFFFKCIDWFEKMFTVLFIFSVVMFGYMMYVLVRPEKF